MFVLRLFKMVANQSAPSLNIKYLVVKKEVQTIENLQKYVCTGSMF